MAISTPTVLIVPPTSSTASVTSVTTASISPAANSLIEVIASAQVGNATVADLSISTTLSGVTFTKNVEAEFNDGSSAKSIQTANFTAVMGASPGSGTITVTRTVAANRWWIEVKERASGFDSTNPVRQAAGNDVGTGTTLSATLGSAPLSGNQISAGIGVRNATAISGDANFTTSTDLTVGTGPPFRIHTSYDNSDPLDGTVDWTGMTSLQAAAGVIVELQAAATVTPKAGSDTLTVGTTDASSSLGAASTLNDTATVGITDASALLAASAVNDNPTIGITDSGSVAGNANVSDPLNVGVTDSGSIAATLSATDTLTVGISDSAAIFEFVAKDVADSLGLGLTDATAIAAQLSTNDPLSISVSEALTLSAQVQGADTLGLTLQEAVALGATVQAADALNLSLTDTIGLFANLEASDVLEISFIGDAAIPSGAVERNLVWLAGNPRHKWVFGSLEAKWNTGKPGHKWKTGEPTQ